mmetsp:Transcript_13889/g.46889  ORF Transcript_13889/g.46889 Transcript_13889/m.46889 type:complete len:168 (+) Transcript_13889:3-506(+)
MAAAAAAVLPAVAPALGLGRAENKPETFDTFDGFYPLYMEQHSDVTCRRFHFVGTSLAFLWILWDPRLVMAMLTAACLGYGLFFLCLPLQHGLVDFAAMGVVFIASGRVLTGTYYKPLAVMVTAYAFAWVGHAFFEQNRPATFVYPVHSLVSDWRLWFDIATGKLAW